MTTNEEINEGKDYIQYLDSVPYRVKLDNLYNPVELFDEFDGTTEGFERSYDTRVYRHVCSTGKMPKQPLEMMARSLHDCEVRRLLGEFLNPIEPRLVVGIMGGHAMRRTDEAYRQTVEVSKRLTEKGYLMISGGGPGAMEATHLGAWMACRTDSEVDDAVAILAKAPTFGDEGWLATAFEVRRKYPLESDYKSLALPTWFYGHEPPCAFATHIAKFFDNSIREDQILTIAYGGLIYMPGSAGTVQEIFQEVCQDHYLTLGYASPMVFVGRDYWNREVPVFPFMRHMLKTGHFKNLLLSLVDTTDAIIKSIDDFESIYDSLPDDCKQR